MLEKPYRLCVGIVLFNQSNQVFIGRRFSGIENSDPSHQWQMPQGGIDPGEEPRMAAARELFEETNITTIRYLAEADDWFQYDLPEDVSTKTWSGKYKGQKQKWFAYKFEGTEKEINVHNPANGRYKAEFKEWRWENFENIPNLVIPFKREVYLSVYGAFKNLMD